MTISTTANSVTIGGTGSLTVFNFSFQASSATPIYVTYTDASGNQTALQPSQFSLTLNAIPSGQIWAPGGYVTYPLVGSPIAAGTTLTITRVVALTQPTSISNQGNFYPQVVERSLDFLEMQLQQIDTTVSNIQADLNSVIIGVSGAIAQVVTATSNGTLISIVSNLFTVNDSRFYQVDFNGILVAPSYYIVSNTTMTFSAFVPNNVTVTVKALGYTLGVSQ